MWYPFNQWNSIFVTVINHYNIDFYDESYEIYNATEEISANLVFSFIFSIWLINLWNEFAILTFERVLPFMKQK